MTLPGPRVSVVMATYNHAAFVKEAIDSVLRQQGVDFEFLIADDGSSDDTRAVVAAIEDHRISFFPNPVNRGACTVLNELVERTRGEYVALINSDDAWYPDKLRYQVDVLDRDPNLGATFGRVTFFDRDTHGLVRLERCQIVRAYPEIAADVKRLVRGSYLLELVDTLTAEKENHPEIFDLLQFFTELLIGKDFREELLRLFELRLFCYLGYQPQFQQCMLCRDQFNLQECYKFSVHRGGIICPRCQGQVPELLPLSNGTIRLFQQAQGLDFAKLSRLYFSQTAHDESRRIFGGFLEFHIGHRPRSLDILGQLS